MTTPTTCCEPCEEQGLCHDDHNCCLECHFGYEEQLAFPFLSESDRTMLREQHAWLIAHDFPPDQVALHTECEMEIFRQSKCPAWVLACIEADHAANLSHAPASEARTVCTLRLLHNVAPGLANIEAAMDQLADAFGELDGGATGS